MPTLPTFYITVCGKTIWNKKDHSKITRAPFVLITSNDLWQQREVLGINICLGETSVVTIVRYFEPFAPLHLNSLQKVCVPVFKPG